MLYQNSSKSILHLFFCPSSWPLLAQALNYILARPLIKKKCTFHNMKERAMTDEQKNAIQYFSARTQKLTHNHPINFTLIHFLLHMWHHRLAKKKKQCTILHHICALKCIHNMHPLLYLGGFTTTIIMKNAKCNRKWGKNIWSKQWNPTAAARNAMLYIHWVI